MQPYFYKHDWSQSNWIYPSNETRFGGALLPFAGGVLLGGLLFPHNGPGPCFGPNCGSYVPQMPNYVQPYQPIPIYYGGTPSTNLYYNNETNINSDPQGYVHSYYPPYTSSQQFY